MVVNSCILDIYNIFLRPVGCQITIYQCSFSSHDADDEFVSESYQGATKKEMAEVNESMRRLGLGGGGGKSNTKFLSSNPRSIIQNSLRIKMTHFDIIF